MLNQSHFGYKHLKDESMQNVSKLFNTLATFLIENMHDDYLKEEALLLLWQSKNLAVLDKAQNIDSN